MGEKRKHERDEEKICNVERKEGKEENNERKKKTEGKSVMKNGADTYGKNRRQDEKNMMVSLKERREDFQKSLSGPSVHQLRRK